jgi:hypothetical protein
MKSSTLTLKGQKLFDLNIIVYGKNKEAKLGPELKSGTIALASSKFDSGSN